MSTPDPATTDWVPIWNLTGSGGGGGGAPTGPAGGVLSGTYPNPGFAADMATQEELNTAVALLAPKASYGTTPPASPADGDEWILPADTTAGVMWRFRYRAASASTYKWEFVGGADLFAIAATGFENCSSTTYVALTTPGPAITLPRAGDYDIEVGARITPPFNSSGTAFMSYDIGATGAADADAVMAKMDDVSQPRVTHSSASLRRKTGLTAVTLTAKYRATDVTGAGPNFAQRWMRATPIRIS